MVNKIKKHLIICDSPDGGGKTSLCNHLIEKYRFNYYHCGVQPDIKEYHSHVLDMAFDDIQQYESNFIIDRLHLSEHVYGTLFRNGPQYDATELEHKIQDAAKDAGITYTLIMCMPPKELIVQKHAERLADSNEMFNTVDNVFDMYSKIYDEDQEKKIYNFYRYDYTKDGDYIQLDEYLESK